MKNNNPLTVLVSPIEGKTPHLYFTWMANPTADDIRSAFAMLYETIAGSSATIHVIVDVSSHPKLPLGETVTKALRVQNHDNMGKWLVVGADWRAEFVGSLMNNISKKNIEWFNTYTDAMQRLNQLIEEQIPT